MRRECSHCQTPFRPEDLAREESKGMEAERKALGLQGVRFLYYTCGNCHFNDIFVDIHPLPGEAPDEFKIRRDALEATIRELHGDRVEVIVVEK